MSLLLLLSASGAATVPIPLLQAAGPAYSMNAGTTLEIPITVTTITGSAYQIGNTPITCLVKYYAGDADSAALATLTTTNGGVVVSTLVLNNATVVVPPSATSGIAGMAILLYTVRVYLSTTQVYDVLTGTITVTQEAVQAIVG